MTYATDQERAKARARSKAKYAAKHLREDPDYQRAQWRAKRAVRYAIEKGRLVRPERCEKCGKAGEVQAHHEDYDKPLEVEWLCRTCHRATFSMPPSYTPDC